MDWSESGYLALSALNVKDGYIDFSQDVHYGNQELYDKWMSGKELHRGQVLFTTEAPMGNVAQVPDNKGYILSQRTIAFDVEEKILSENFLATLLRTPNVFNDLIALSSGGTAKGVSQKSLSGLDVVIPKNIDEQNKLADYFINLDNLITLHQRKYLQKKKTSLTWEQRKLGDVVERVTRKNQDLVSQLPLTISAQYGLIDQNMFFDKRVASKDVSGYYLIYNGEFAYNKSTSSDAPWGAIKRLDRYENGVLSTLYIVFKIKNEKVINSDFLVTYYDTCNWHKDIKAVAAEGARNHGLLNIAPADFFKTELMLPQDIEEQKKIGSYFKLIDHLITLHQRKCDQMKELKKYMLTKMFPQNGAKVPEIRFDGFIDDWEQRKLGDVCSRVQGNDGRMELPTLTISASNGWMKQEDRFSGNIAGKEQKNYTLLHKGELSYNHGNSKLAKYGTVFSLQSYEEALVPRVYHSFKVEEGNTDFIEYYFATKLPDRELGKLISSGARMDGLLNIGYKEFMGIQLLFPKTKEQECIANYFRNLDHLITLHQSKCENLKNLKEYLLRNMFV